MVPLTAWVECSGGHKANGGYRLFKSGYFWIAAKNGKELVRDRHLFNVMMELCA